MLIAQAPPVPVVAVDRPTQVSAYGSGVLFSKRDPAGGRFKLWYTETGRPPAPLPIADRGVPFDADLGPGAHGHFLAVYSRCEREPRWDPVDEDAPPNYSLARGCDLYELDLTTQRERRLFRTSASEVLPTVWKDGLAFARVYSSTKIVLYHRKGGGTSRRMPGGPADGRPNGLDLYGRRLAFGWEYPGRFDGPASDLWLDDVRTARARLIERFRGGGLTTISLTAPAFEGGKLYYAKLCQGDESGCPGRAGLIRVRYSTGARARAKIGVQDLWQARGEGLTYVLRDDGGARSCFSTATGGPQETCTLLATTPDYE
jgi:hypothetical protein